jgi:hypothetical protein
VKKKPSSRFLLERPHAASVYLAEDFHADNQPDPGKLDAEILRLIQHARRRTNSPLVRLDDTFPPFAIGKSTFLKHVRLKEQIQPVHYSPRVTAYRVVDRDVTLASMTLAARHGFMLNMKTFIAVLYAPLDNEAAATS